VLHCTSLQALNSKSLHAAMPGSMPKWADSQT
jgi:hypothetical protein